jgi:hypothetical protein
MTPGFNEPPRPEPTQHQQELDAWQREMWRQIGLAIGRWLEQRGRLHQPIKSLQLHELEGIAWAAVSEYGAIREAKRLELNLPLEVYPEKPDQLARLLTG